MNIVCEKCNTVYRFDAGKIPPDGKKVKCSNCQHVFRVMPEKEGKSEAFETDGDVTGESGNSHESASRSSEGTSSTTGEEGKKKRRLLLRQDGTRYAVNDLATLQRWVVERRVTREAELSEDGEVWEKVGERMDLLPFFSIVERSRARKRARRLAAGLNEDGLPMPSPRGAPAANGREGVAVKGPRGSASPVATSDGELDSDLAEAAKAAGSAEGSSGTSPFSGIDMGRNELPTALRSTDNAPEPAEEPPKEPSSSQPATPAKPIPTPTQTATIDPHAAPAAESKGGFEKFILLIASLMVIAVGAYVLFFKAPNGDDKEQSTTSKAPPVAQKGTQGNADRGTTGHATKPSSGTKTAKVEPAGTGDSRTQKGTAAPETQSATKVGETREGAKDTDAQADSSKEDSATKTASTNATPKPGGTSGGTSRASAQASNEGTKEGATNGKQTTASASTPKPAPRPPTSKGTSSKLRSVRTTSTGTAGRKIQIARHNIRQHKYKEAVNVLRGAAKQFSKDAVVHKELAWALLNLADVSYADAEKLYRECIDECNTAIKLNSRLAEAYHLKGVAHMNLEESAPAIEAFKAALANGLRGDDATEAKAFMRRLQANSPG